MAHREILLLQPLANLGAEGDLVKVRAGYARNFLLPRGLAVPVTLANRKHVESLRAKRTERESKELAGARELADKLKAVSLAFAVKTGEGGKMFGSITQGDVLARLEKEGFKLDKKVVHIAGGHVKSLGKHDATLKLHPEVTVEITFEVVSENPIEEVKPAEAVAATKERRPPRPPRSEPKDTLAAALDELDAPKSAAAEPAEAPKHKAKKRVRKEGADGEAKTEA